VSAATGELTPVAATLGPTFERARLPTRRPLRVVLLLSGGLDSVALFVNLLAATEHEVHAHHIELDNLERRAGAENQALDRIRSWADANLRPFEWSTSAHSFHLPLGAGGWDTTLTMFTASRVVRALGPWRADAVVTGHINPGFPELSEGEAVFHAGFQSRRWRPAWVRPLARMTGGRVHRKALIRDSLPPEVVDLCWWCRRPVVDGDGWKRCDACHACKVMSDAGALGGGSEAATPVADG
jgi:hypothetical protein